MAVALLGKWPTITVSTMAMVIQPSSASTSGRARRSVAGSCLRRDFRRSMIGTWWDEFKRAVWNTQTD